MDLECFEGFAGFARCCPPAVVESEQARLLHVDIVFDFLTEQTRLLVFIPDASPELSRKIILLRAHTSSLVSSLYILLLSLIFELSRTSIQVSMAS